MLGLVYAFLIESAPAEAANTVTLTPEADAWVSNDAPGANHGAEGTLQIGGFSSSSDKRTYVRFTGSIPAGDVVTRTTLRLYFDSAPSGNYDVRVANPAASSWNEQTMTWNTPPPAFTGPVTSDTTSITPGWNSISVPLFPPGGRMTYVLTRAGTTAANIESKENVNKPELVVEYAPPDTTTRSVCSATGCVESRPWVTTMSWGIAVADFNGDGRDDYLVTRHSQTEDQIQLQQSDGSFTPDLLHFPGGNPPGHFPSADRHGCTAGDVNGDQRIDLYCMIGGDGGEGMKSNELWIAQPDGTYLNQATAWGVSDPYGRGRRPLLFNFNHSLDYDGPPDLYISNFGPRADMLRSENILYLNNMGASFMEKPVSAGGTTAGTRCVADGDFDRDLYLDLVVCGSQLHLFHNGEDPGGGRLTEQSDFLLDAQVAYPTDATLADVNGDGWDDLIVITKTRLQIRLNRGPNNPIPRFTTSFSAPLVDGGSVAVGDLTGDGFPDVYVVEGIVNGPDGPQNAADKLFTGPNWAALEVPQVDTGTGDSSKFINVLGRKALIVTNGREYARGPVQFITFHPNTYVRPRGASPLKTALVPAYTECTSANRSHGAPLAFGSCAPPTQTSSYLTLGTPDANGERANSIASVRYATVLDNPATPADEADVAIKVAISDVRNKSDLSDFTGALQLVNDLRITDKTNTLSTGRPGPATVQDTSLWANVPCTATVSSTIGSDCNLLTTVNALYAGAVRGGSRTVWELPQVRVYDGGADGNPSTADNTLFMTEGLFVP